MTSVPLQVKWTRAAAKSLDLESDFSLHLKGQLRPTHCYNLRPMGAPGFMKYCPQTVIVKEFTAKCMQGQQFPGPRKPRIKTLWSLCRSGQHLDHTRSLTLLWWIFILLRKLVYCLPNHSNLLPKDSVSLGGPGSTWELTLNSNCK